MAGNNTDNWRPGFVEEIVGSVPTDYWKPQSLEEWSRARSAEAIINAWVEQQNQERELKKIYACWVFVLISFQIIAIFLLVVLEGLNHFQLNENIIKILLPTALAEIFGMGFLVVKYLFRESTQSLINLLPEEKGR